MPTSRGLLTAALCAIVAATAPVPGSPSPARATDPVAAGYEALGTSRPDHGAPTVRTAPCDRARDGPHGSAARGRALPDRCRTPAGPHPSPWQVDGTDTGRVAAEIGAGSLNPPSRNGVHGADLGHMFVHDGRLLMVFGDTFGGPAAQDFFSVRHEDWRSNTIGVASATASPARGVTFTGMISDRPGHAKELLASRKIDGVEQTVIPTYGVSVGNRAYLYYMSVRAWGRPGQWTLNHSGIAYSDDGGTTWTTSPVTWSGASNFGQVATVERNGYVYLYGIPGGRYGDMRLARVRQDEILTRSAYRYWDGGTWVRDESAATPIVPGPVGEMSVQYNSHYRTYLMMYLVDSTQQIVLRTSDSLTGPWSDPQVVADGDRYPQLYAPYIMPVFNDGEDIWFTMSMYGSYDVSLMHTSLDPRSPTAPLPPALVPEAAPTTPPYRPTSENDHGAGSTPTPSTGG